MNNKTNIEQLFGTMFQLKKLISNQTHETREERMATILQFSALNFIKEQKNGSMSDLSSSLQLSKSSATQLIERLSKAHLVERINDTEDRRNVRLKITEKGSQEYIELKKKIMQKMTKILSKIPDEDVKELIRIHTNLINTLTKESHS